MPAVELIPLTEDEFPGWSEHACEAFAADLVRALGATPEAARERAAAVFAEALPNGLATPGTRVWWIAGDGARVGHLWFGPHPQREDGVFAYDIEVDEAHRGQGFGAAAIEAAERLLAAEGIREIGLSVFGFNDGAKQLYERVGFRVVATQMTKTIG